MEELTVQSIHELAEAIVAAKSKDAIDHLPLQGRADTAKAVRACLVVRYDFRDAVV